MGNLSQKSKKKELKNQDDIQENLHGSVSGHEKLQHSWGLGNSEAAEDWEGGVRKLLRVFMKNLKQGVCKNV